MIAIVRPAAPPILHDRGAAARQKLCEAYTAAPHEYRSGAKQFEFDPSIFAADMVRRVLLDAQHNKCAFCESLFRHVGYGDVEHFRPKSGHKQKPSDELKWPGYYWLAYEWENLFCSCQLCNQRFKRNLFPLRDARRRARAHTHNLTKEEPLIVDPAKIDPGCYLGFRQEYVHAVNGCAEGATTIEVFGLNRDALVENRRQSLESLRDLLLLRQLLRETIARAPRPELLDRLAKVEGRLRQRREAGSEYAAMTRAFLAETEPN